MSTSQKSPGLELSQFGLEFAANFVVNTAERLDDLFGPGSIDGGCSIIVVHKSSPECELCENAGEWDEPGDLAYKVKGEYYIYIMDKDSATRRKADLVRPDCTYTEIWWQDYCISGYVNMELVKASESVNSRGGDA